MNDFKVKLTKDKKGQVIGPNTVYMKLTALADADNSLGGVLRARYEIELLRGSRTPCPDGGAEYFFEVDDEKGQELLQALTIAHFMPNEN